MPAIKLTAAVLVLAAAALAPASFAAGNASLQIPANANTNAKTEFTVSLSEMPTATASLRSKLTVSPADATSVLGLEQLSGSSWNGLSLQAEGADRVAYTSHVAAVTSFRVSFAKPGDYVVGYTLESVSGSQVATLMSAAMPIKVTGGAVLGTSKFAFQNNLRYGNRNSQVLELQKRLTLEGVYSGPQTSYFGPLTLAAVKRYQSANGVPATGFVGPMTRAKLNQ